MLTLSLIFKMLKHQDRIPCSFDYKLVFADNRLSKPIVVFRGEDAAFKNEKTFKKKFDHD